MSITGSSVPPSSSRPTRNEVTILLIVVAAALAVTLALIWSGTTGSAGHGAPGGPPTGLTETAATITSVTLSWTAPPFSSSPGGVTGYDVSYTEGHSPGSCGIWGPLMNVGTGLTATVTGLSEDTTYCFEVSAVYANGSINGSVWLTDAETLGPEGQATNALDDTTAVSTQTFSVTAGQLMLATVTSFGSNSTPLLTAQNAQTFRLLTAYTNAADPELVTYVFDTIANLTTSSEVVTLTDPVASEYMLGVVSYSGYTGVTSVGTWVTGTGTTVTANVSAATGATLVACIGYVTDVGGASFNPAYAHATWSAATLNSRADQWYLIGGATAGPNFGTVTRGLAGATSLVLLALG